jgi:hypothetical protein
MRSSVILRIAALVFYAIFLHIALYFADQDHIGDYNVYILFAMASVPVFLFVLLGTNKND